MYFTTTSKIWKHLERRYLITNGARKYQLNKNVYDAKQNSMSVNECYTYMNMGRTRLLERIASVVHSVRRNAEFLGCVKQTEG